VEQPEDARLLDRDRLPREQGKDRVAGVVRLDGLHLGVVKAADVPELAGRVEDVDVGGGQNSIRLGRALGLAVVELGIGELVITGSDELIQRQSIRLR